MIKVPNQLLHLRYALDTSHNARGRYYLSVFLSVYCTTINTLSMSKITDRTDLFPRQCINASYNVSCSVQLFCIALSNRTTVIINRIKHDNILTLI